MEEKETEALICLQNERNMLTVIIFTIIAMVGEITFGYITNSMSLLAEGCHMSVHVLTLGLTYIAYILARKFRNSELFKNGTSKIGVLAGYTSAIFLAITGFGIMFESSLRFIHPEEIQFKEAIYASVFALIINYICIAVMEDKFHLHHHKQKENKDYNYKAAYYHILSDVLMSILTIVALVIGQHFNCIHLDSLAGIFGAMLILIWSVKLLKTTIKILIDMK